MKLRVYLREEGAPPVHIGWAEPEQIWWGEETSPYRWEALGKTATGMWLLGHITRWQGEQSYWTVISPSEAEEWLREHGNK